MPLDTTTPDLGFLDAARHLRRVVEAEGKSYDRTITELARPLIERLRRHPKRPVRQEMLTALVRDWYAIAPVGFRLSIGGSLDKGRACVTERRVVSGRLRRNGEDRDTDAEDEANLGVTEVTLTVADNRARLTSVCLCTLSIHAVATRLRRAPGGSTAALLADVNLAADAASTGKLIAGAGYRVRTEGGAWLGRCLLHFDGVGESRVVAFRTWLADG